jgi:hypothetical protein
LPQLAARPVAARRLAARHDLHRRRALPRKMIAQRARSALERPIVAPVLAGIEAQRETIRRALNDLEPMLTCRLLDDPRERHRQKAHQPPGWSRDRQHVVAATPNQDRRQRIAT